MLTLRLSQDRGHANHGWLDTYHSFSFANYYDPKQMGFASLRVLNEDRVAPKMGFPTHGHNDMEIITYVLEGVLKHEDSMRNGSLIRAGEVQRMSAGTGITHSEYNASTSKFVHLLQIWILPEVRGLTPSYAQKAFPAIKKQGKLCLVASPDGREESVIIHQDVSLYVTLLSQGNLIKYILTHGRKAYVHVARGTAVINNHHLRAGDAAKIEQEQDFVLSTYDTAEVLLFDLA